MTMTRIILALLVLVSVSARAQFVPDYLIHPTSACASNQTVQYLTPGSQATCWQVPYSALSGTPSIAIGSTVTSGTAGSILFVNAGPVLAQDNANLHYDDSANVLYSTLGNFGGGTYNANTTLATSGADTAHVLEVVINPNGGDAVTGLQGIRMASYGTAAFANNLHSERYRGTEASPTAIQSGDAIESWGFRGYTSAGNLAQSSAAFYVKAEENFSGTGNGTAIYFDTQGNGTVFPRVNNIKIGPGLSPALQVFGPINVTATSAPSTPASGVGAIYIDSTSKNIAVKDDAGVVKHGVQTKASVLNSFVTAISDAGVVSAAQPAFTDISGTATFGQGGTGLTSASDDTVMVSSGSAWVAKAMPDCTDTGGNHINYTASTNAFSCGTTGGGGSGVADPGGNGVMVRTALNTTVARTITGGTGISISNGDGVSGNPTISATGATSDPLTTAGDLWYWTTTDARLGASAINGATLTAHPSDVTNKLRYERVDFRNDMVRLLTTSYGATNVDCVYSGANTGAISSVASQAGHVGIVQLTTASANNALNRIGCHNGATPSANSGIAGLVIPGGGVNIATCFVVQYSALPSSAQDYSLDIGLRDLTSTAGGANNIVGIGLNWAASNDGTHAEWRTLMKANNGSTTARNNISDAPAAAAWHTVCATWNTGGTQIDFSVDGALVQSETTNLPTIALAPQIQFDKTVGTTTVTLLVDDVKVYTFD